MTTRTGTDIKAYEAVADVLQQAGVEHIFGVMGEDTAPLLVAAVDRGITYYAARHENQAVAMADGYSRVSGRMGVATFTSGPGFTNALSAITTGVRARSRLLLICGSGRPEEDEGEPETIRRIGRIAPKRLQHTRVLDGLDIRWFKPSDAARMTSATSAAIAETSTDAAFLLLGRKLLLEPAGRTIRPLTPVAAPALTVPDPRQVSDVADLLGETWTAGHPVVLAGRGALSSGAGAALRRLGELSGAVLATTLPAAGMFDGDDFNIGICGTFSTPVASGLITKADCVLAFGAGLNPFTTYDYTLFPKAHLVQVDRQPEELGRLMKPAIAMHADARLAAEAIVSELERRGHREAGFRSAETRQAIAAFSSSEGVTDQSTTATIDPNTLAIALDRMLPYERIVCTDAGKQMRFAMRHLGFHGGRNFVWGVEFGTIGICLGHAIGAQVARPEVPVAAFVGDGSLMMALGDLDTVGRLNLPMLIVVSNDDGFGAEVNILANLGLDVGLAKTPGPSFERIATAMGVRAAVIETVGDLGVVTDWLAAGRPGPLLIDCRVNQAVKAVY